MSIRNKLAAALCGLLLASSANAATLVSTASGNINATGTWSVIERIFEQLSSNSETAYLLVFGAATLALMLAQVVAMLFSWRTFRIAIAFVLVCTAVQWIGGVLTDRHLVSRMLDGNFVRFAVGQSQRLDPILLSIASGNINANATWSLVEPGTFNNSNTSQVTCGNNAFAPASPTSSLAASSAAVLNGLGGKIASIAGATGTIQLQLFDVTASSAVAGSTTAAINISNLPQTPLPTATVDDGGWVFGLFSSGTTVTLTNGHDYALQCKASTGASTVQLQGSAATTLSQILFTTTNQAPAAGDISFIAGQYSSTGTLVSNTVTVNTTANINYGAVSNTLISPSISFSQGGTLAYATTASTNFAMEFAGPAVIYNGGKFTIGVPGGTTIPATSTATLTLNSTVEGDTGINVRNGGTFNAAGNSGGRSVVKTKLTSAISAGSSVAATTADSTGWLSGDSVEVAATQITNGTVAGYKDDQTTLAGNASGQNISLTTIANSHSAAQLSYTSSSTGNSYALNMYADVVLLNRNVVIQGSGATTNGYLYFQANSIGAMDWTEFSQISGGVAKQRGIEADTGPLGSFSLTNFSIINSHHTSLALAPTNTDFGGTPGAYVTVQHGVLYNVATDGSGTAYYGLAVLTGSYNPYWKIDDVAVIRAANGNGATIGINLVSQNGQFSNISVSGSGLGLGGFGINATGTISGQYGGMRTTLGGGINNPFGPITTYANVGSPIVLASLSGTVSGLYAWHENQTVKLIGSGSLTIDPFYLITSPWGIYTPNGMASLTVRNGVIGWDSNVNPFVLVDDSVPLKAFLDNMDLCPTGLVGGVTFITPGCGSSTNNVISLEHDLTAGGSYYPGASQVFLRNSSILNGSTIYPTLNGEESYYGPNAYVIQDCALCSPVKHGAWVPGGFISYDTAIVHTVGGYSERMTPRVNTYSGYISSGSGSTSPGTILTLTSGSPVTPLGDGLISNGGSFVAGTNVLSSNSAISYNVSQSQSVGSNASPVQFQSYWNNNNSAGLRMQSAPRNMGSKVAVKSGVSNAQFCEYLRPSINTDAAPPWGGSAVTYNGDPPRMIVRQNPAMGVQQDTVIATSSPTAGTWGQFCGTLPTAPNDGTFEIAIDADQTFTSNAGGWVNIAEPSCTNCTLANNTEFWFNGVPFDTNVPGGGGGGGGGTVSHVGTDGIFN